MVETFLMDNLLAIAVIMIILEVIWLWYTYKNKIGIVGTVIPIAIVLIIWMSAIEIETTNLYEDKKDFCLEQGFSDYSYASETTGIEQSIVCIEKGNLKYFTFENGIYYEIPQTQQEFEQMIQEEN